MICLSPMSDTIFSKKKDSRKSKKKQWAIGIEHGTLWISAKLLTTMIVFQMVYYLICFFTRVHVSQEKVKKMIFKNKGSNIGPYQAVSTGLLAQCVVRCAVL
jgi:hypothetical protein